MVPRMVGKQGKELIQTNMVTEWPAHHQDRATEIKSFLKSNMKQHFLRC